MGKNVSMKNTPALKNGRRALRDGFSPYWLNPHSGCREVICYCEDATRPGQWLAKTADTFKTVNVSEADLKPAA